MIRPDDRDRIEINTGVDTDLDGHPDTVLLPDPLDFALLVDVDRDGLADLFIRIGPDGAASTTDLTVDPVPWWPTDPAADACYDPFWTDRP
ncbi:MAG: hypothetical protein QOI50_2092 [Pseudonocardiales bacterium]|jgi:hypothetical protein|uniref:hypothetical protein n=1 Tax=Pseudonocardia sp. Cha107L01 TaxID=3457576 RepID=UPI0028C5B97E|nr:hypothetical protein [Pseudonocardia sp.]MDT7558082.1 hypothetical protein [Pseudonocardiales bacterium]MDT7584831.1 hypothetical protein [Pseudonocardiales bacterium]MDT7630162.1 hypothetical protein [Pseudonocardiales bacterium]MDT7647834.1 hypothetical protein [Pseudonocardiales bacterium]